MSNYLFSNYQGIYFEGEFGCDSDLVVVVDCQIPADDLIVHDL